MDNTEIAIALTEVSERAKSNTHRIEDIEKGMEKVNDKVDSIYTINTNIEKMCMSLAHTNEKLDENTKKLDENIQDVKSVRSEITEIKNAPYIETAEKWKKAVGYISATIGGGLLMYLLSQIAPAIFK